MSWRLDGDESNAIVTLSHKAIVPEAAPDFAIGWHLILDELSKFVAPKFVAEIPEDYEAIDQFYRSL